MSHKLATSITVIALGLVACGGGDDSDTTNVTNATTITTSVSTTEAMESSGGESSSGGTSASTTMPTDESSTAPSESSSGGGCAPTDECQDDPDCPGGGMCLDCICVGGETTGGGASDYGPCDMCAAGEMPLQIMGLEGCFCSPPCDGMMCPAPSEGTAQAMCVLGTMMGADPTNCALICDPAMDGMCPTGAMCVDTGMPNVGICMHPAP
jgi:hypothetical protein